MLTIEQIREMTDACEGLGYATSYNYDGARDDFASSRTRVERVHSAVRALSAGVEMPDVIKSLLTSVLTLEAVHSYSAKVQRGDLTKASQEAYREACIAAAQEICDWWRGEGRYAPAPVETEAAPMPDAESPS